MTEYGKVIHVLIRVWSLDQSLFIGAKVDSPNEIVCICEMSCWYCCDSRAAGDRIQLLVSDYISPSHKLVIFQSEPSATAAVTALLICCFTSRFNFNLISIFPYSSELIKLIKEPRQRSSSFNKSLVV